MTLLEALLLVLMLAIAVPPALSMLQSRTDDRVNAINTSRAGTLAGAVLDQVFADAASESPGLGFGAFASPSAYVSDLETRISAITQASDDVGITWDVQFSGLVSDSGVATGNVAEDIFRIVTVTVTCPDTRGGSFDVVVEGLVADL